jgi:2'-5' RNA ligase
MDSSAADTQEKRLFIAIEIPSEIRKKIYETAKAIEQDGIRRVEEENLHVTLKFIGEVSESKVQEIIAKLQKITCSKLECEAKTVGVFPNESYIRVVWVGLECPELAELAKYVSSALHGIGKPDDHVFSAHLTIARVKKKTDLNKFLQENKEKEFGRFEISEFVLFESKLTPNGPVYTKIASFDLQ